MGLVNRHMYKKPRPLTEEDKKNLERVGKQLQDTGCSNLSDPSKQPDSLKELLQKDPDLFFHHDSDIHISVPYSEFYEHLMSGESNEKHDISNT